MQDAEGGLSAVLVLGLSRFAKLFSPISGSPVIVSRFRGETQAIRMRISGFSFFDPFRVLQNGISVIRPLLEPSKVERDPFRKKKVKNKNVNTVKIRCADFLPTHSAHNVATKQIFGGHKFWGHLGVQIFFRTFFSPSCPQLAPQLRAYKKRLSIFFFFLFQDTYPLSPYLDT